MPTREITQRVSEHYTKAARTDEQMCCATSYDMADLKSFIPEEVLKISYGCGTPAGLKTMRTGETVLDIGSGGGIDYFEAARFVGPSGHIIGIDMTDAMLDIARRNAQAAASNLGYASCNIEFRKDMADAMPVDDDTIDVIISNCIINLAPRRVFREMFRIAKPGGRFTISDIVSDQTVPQYLVHDVDKWGDCLSRALRASDSITGLVEAGFVGIHSMTSSPWRIVNGIQFFSLTLTSYKLRLLESTPAVQYAPLRGPFSRVVDERGTTYLRGIPQPIGSETVQLLCLPPHARHFVVSADPVWLDRDDTRRSAVLPRQVPCAWAAALKVLETPPYVKHFAMTCGLEGGWC
jgi:arsenite methyltransferase